MNVTLARFQGAAHALADLPHLLLAGSGSLQDRLAAMAGSAEGQREAFAVLRLARPHLALADNPIACYPAQGALLVTLAADVDEVLRREADFSVVYEPRMRRLTGGANFFLGMQDGPEYQRNAQAMRRLVQADDLARQVLPGVHADVQAALQATPGQLDLPPRLTARVPARMVQHYFGLHTAPEALLVPWATAMFHFLFSDLAADPSAEAAAVVAAEQTRAALDAAVASPMPGSLIARAVAARDAGEPAFAGDGIRNNFIGIVIGAIPTLSKAACYALDELFRRPEALASAMQAARAGDEVGVAAHVWEALRFNPPNPLVYRRAMRDCRLGETAIAQGTMVLAANLSAMHDEAVVPEPREFRTDRPWHTYQLWGSHVHQCFGDRINQAVLPAVLMPLLALPGLARAPGAQGALDGHFNGQDTAYPRHFGVVWAAS